MKIRGGVPQTTVANILLAIVATIGGVLVARVLGPADRGVLATTVAWFTVVLALTEFGTTPGITFLCARNPLARRSIVRSAQRLYAPYGLVAFGSMFSIALLVGERTDSSLMSMLIFAIFTPIAMQVAPPTFALLAFDVSRWNIARLVQPVIYLVAVTLLAYVQQLEVVTVAFAFGLSLVAAWTTSLWLFQRALRSGDEGQPSDPHPSESDPSIRIESPSSAVQRGKIPDFLRPLWSYGWRNFPSTIPGAVVSRLDVLVLSAFASPVAVGNYAVAATLALLVQPFSSAIPQLALPRVARLGSAPSSQRLRKTTQQTLAVSGLVASIAAVAVSLAAPTIVERLLGDAYAESASLAAVLCIGAPATALVLASRSLLRGGGSPTLVALPEWLGLIVLAGFLYVLVPSGGPTGAAQSVSAAAWVQFLMYGVVLRKWLRAAGS